MVDKVNPTNQFHPYQPQTSTPHSARPSGSRLGGILNKAGIDRERIDAVTKKVNLRGGLDKARSMARGNGGMLLGGLAALAIGAGLMRRRSLR
jgi:hypothetical protein